jgi:hypothetical protein
VLSPQVLSPATSQMAVGESKSPPTGSQMDFSRMNTGEAPRTKARGSWLKLKQTLFST